MNPLIPRAAKPAQEAQLAEQQETREREMQVWLGRNTIEQLQRRCACHSFRFDRVYVVCILDGNGRHIPRQSGCHTDELTQRFELQRIAI